MHDREKIVKGLEACLPPHDPNCDICPYDSIDLRCRAKLRDDIIALLKAQEPRDAVVVQNGIDRSGGWWFQCPICKMEVEPRDKYCKNCGQGVKWE